MFQWRWFFLWNELKETILYLLIFRSICICSLLIHILWWVLYRVALNKNFIQTQYLSCTLLDSIDSFFHRSQFGSLYPWAQKSICYVSLLWNHLMWSLLFDGNMALPLGIVRRGLLLVILLLEGQRSPPLAIEMVGKSSLTPTRTT